MTCMVFLVIFSAFSVALYLENLLRKFSYVSNDLKRKLFDFLHEPKESVWFIHIKDFKKKIKTNNTKILFPKL